MKCVASHNDLEDEESSMMDLIIHCGLFQLLCHGFLTFPLLSLGSFLNTANS